MLISDFLTVAYEQTLRLGRSKFRLAVLGSILLIVIFINGIGDVPEAPYQRLAENPFVTRTDIHFNNYWQENPLLPVIAYVLGLSSPAAFRILCFGVILGGFLLFERLSRRRWGPERGLIFTVLLMTSPLTTVMLTWLGTPDGLTLALTIPFLFSRSTPLFLFLSILGTANHPAFTLAALEILILRWAARDGIHFRHAFVSGIGFATGYGLVQWFLAVHHIEIVSRADFLLLRDAGEWLKMNASNLPISLFSLFNLHGLILPICLLMFFKRDRTFFSLALTFLAVNYGFTFFTLDTTRVFSLLSWGVLFAVIFHSNTLSHTAGNAGTETQKQFLQALIVISLASVFSPRYFSWGGEIHVTPFYQLMRKVFR
jgi:hypothetical protein